MLSFIDPEVQIRLAKLRILEITVVAFMIEKPRLDGKTVERGIEDRSKAIKVVLIHCKVIKTT